MKASGKVTQMLASDDFGRQNELNNSIRHLKTNEETTIKRKKGVVKGGTVIKQSITFSSNPYLKNPYD